MQVRKRDGKIVEFDKSRIVNVINRASVETVKGLDETLSYSVANIVFDKVQQLEGISSVETIQDIVETALMDSGRHDVAKQYILYRNDRNKSRNKGIKYKLLDDEFISPYKHKPSTMKPIGEFVYYRTYSRWLPEHKRREYWWETVRRAVEFNCNLVPNVSKAEAQQLFDNMYNLRQFLSGRTMWVGNTEVSKEHGIANYNCSFVVIDEFCKFHELFYALMVGTGVGFRVLKTDVNKLPHARTDIRLIHEQYTPISKGNRQDNTSIEFLNNFAQIKVGDSKEGWVQALELYFKIISDKAYKGVNTIVINYDNVRPKGEKLKRFGGTASGHESLKNMFTKIHNVITNDSISLNKKLKPIDCLDICNIIGENVVVGGVRRCLPKGSLVHTDNGLIPIEQVQIGNNVLTSKGYHRVTDWVEQGEQELLTIKTQMGEFKCTPRHKIAILNNINSYEWKMAKDLQRGDKMIFIRESIGGKNLSLPDYKHVKNNHDTNSVDIVIPKLDEEVAWFLGYLHGNGYVGKNSVSISIPNNNTIIDKVRRCFAKFGTNIINKLSKSNWIVLESKSIQLANYLSQFKKANTSINIPSFILQNMEEIRTAYLIGLYDSDGTSKNRPVVAVSSIYPMYLKQVQSLYASLSIPTRLELKRIGKGNWKDLYTITVVGENAKIDFISKIGSKSVKFVNDAKTLRSGHSYGYPNSWVTNINNKNLWSKTSKQMTVETYERITGEIQKLIPIEIEELIYTGEIAETYDISVDTANEFVCEGYLVHNTAEIGLIDADDSETIEAKASLYYQNKDGAWVENKAISHRKMSNNSIFYLEKPTREQLKWQMQQMRYSGEPGFINVKAARKRREDFEGLNPCAEILLRDRGLCNLTTVNIMSFVDNGKINEEALLKAQRLSARAGLRMTCLELEMHQWHLTQYEDRLLGCSLTGWQDAMNAVGYNMEQQKELLKKLKEVANAEATEYSIFLNIPRPKLVCTIKPEGTISQLPTVSSGVHYSHSPYYVRRIRINANDPLVKVCEELNYPVHPEVGQELETCNTKVVEFPVKAPQGKTKYDVSALEQLEIYRTFQENYTDHNLSITVHVRNEEWDKVEEWLWNNWDDVVAVSFLSLDDSFYPLLPYEAITEKEYNERVSKMKPLIPSLISKYEADETELDVGNDGCETGVCPVR